MFSWQIQTKAASSGTVSGQQPPSSAQSSNENKTKRCKYLRSFPSRWIPNQSLGVLAPIIISHANQASRPNCQNFRWKNVLSQLKVAIRQTRANWDNYVNWVEKLPQKVIIHFELRNGRKLTINLSPNGFIFLLPDWPYLITIKERRKTAAPNHSPKTHWLIKDSLYPIFACLVLTGEGRKISKSDINCSHWTQSGATSPFVRSRTSLEHRAS